MTTLIDVPSSGTPKKTVRVEDALWEAFGEACKADGISCAEDLRNHMKWKVQQHAQKQAQAQPEAPADDQPKS